MPELGRVFVQAESELGAINMLYGSACAGVRAMTTTSSPGFSLMQESISYIALSFVPCVIVNIMRGGPGLGNIQPAQGDYFQMTKGGGHGDYNLIVLAPSTVQEAVNLVIEAFDLADKYLQPVAVIADGMIGQIMEPVELPEISVPMRPEHPWALTGALGRPKNIITSLHLNPEQLERENLKLQNIIAEIRAKEVRYAEYMAADAEILIVAYGTAGRIAQTAVKQARSEGIKAGLFRPVSMFPFPYDPLRELANSVRHVLVVELSAGQMIEDVQLAMQCQVPISFFGKMGGLVPLPEEIVDQTRQIVRMQA
jgi:2-oxoglutarate ferredoxin oxidoreductase subunit alpha